MYKLMSNKNHQVSFFDFNQSCGMELDETNEWIQLGNAIPWAVMEVKYSTLFPSKKGRRGTPFRIAFGILVIQKRKGLSDRKVIKEIAENPYLQYFLGMESFTHTAPVKPTVLVTFRKRLNTEYLMEINEFLLSLCSETNEHTDERESANAIDANTPSDEVENLGTMILDATCSPSKIRYPQDFSLLNEAREKLENMIDYFHHTYHPWEKPRTYRRRARDEYLSYARTKKRTEKKTRFIIRRQLGYVKRDIGYLDDYMKEGYAPRSKDIDTYLTILKLYEQQQYMFDHKTHRVKDRIVSINQPYIRPIVRGKVKNPVEFGAKYDVSIDEKGHARLEVISFDPYNESTIFKDALERYKNRTGHYPKRVLVDQIYRTRENRRYCKERNIIMSGPRLGRPASSGEKSEVADQDNRDRIEVERFFSLEKRCNGAGLITTKLSETTLSSIAMSVLVTNLFSTKLQGFFTLYFTEDTIGDKNEHYMIMDDKHSK